MEEKEVEKFIKSFNKYVKKNATQLFQNVEEIDLKNLDKRHLEKAKLLLKDFTNAKITIS